MPDRTIFTVTSTEDSGAGSLRGAIERANAAGHATIAFAIGTGPVTIRPNGPLPPIAFSGSIDGRTQPGYAGRPVVEIWGGAVPAPPPASDPSPFVVENGGIPIVGTGLTLRGLAINAFPATGLHIEGASDLAILGCYIGLALDGATGAGNGQVGIAISESKNTRIGGAGEPVVVAGNATHGILANSAGNLNVSNAFVGTNADGSAAVPNGGSGLKTWNCPGLAVGGATQVSVFSGNARYGMEVAGAGTTGATVTGCRVGTNFAGTAALGNGRTGLLIYSSAGARIGGPSAAERNIVSGNLRGGINIDGSVAANGDPSGSGGTGLTHDNLIVGNHIGTDVTGEIAIPNLLRGILICYSQVGRIDGNLISGNGEDGILVLGPAPPQTSPLLVPTDSTILRNRIGVSASGKPLPNARHGVFVRHGSRNRVGTDDPADANTIANNGKRGVTFRGAGWDSNVLGENIVADNGQNAFYAAP